jgi:hypothetical protein
MGKAFGNNNYQKYYIYFTHFATDSLLWQAHKATTE